MKLCVYAVTSAQSGLPGTRGMARERLRRTTAGAISAVVGELRYVPAPTLPNLRRYERVIQRLFQRQPALLPMRFGTWLDPDELTLVLSARHDTLRASLSLVRHRVQMTVRVLQAPGSADDARPMTRVPDSNARSGTRYLRGRAEAAAREKDVPGFAAVRNAVARWVREERVEKRGGIATVYHLIPRGSAGPYQRAIDRALAAAGLRAVVTGPWPPYAFVSW